MKKLLLIFAIAGLMAPLAPNTAHADGSSGGENAAAAQAAQDLENTPNLQRLERHMDQLGMTFYPMGTLPSAIIQGTGELQLSDILNNAISALKAGNAANIQDSLDDVTQALLALQQYQQDNGGASRFVDLFTRAKAALQSAAG